MVRQPIKPAPGAGHARFALHSLLWVLLALVLVVSLVRGAGLAAGRDLGTARGERQWHSFAASHSELVEPIASAADQLVPGEAVYLVVPAGRYQERWLRTMLLYHWPEQRLVGIFERGGDPPPVQATRVAISWNGRLWITRGGRELEPPGSSADEPVASGESRR